MICILTNLISFRDELTTILSSHQAAFEIIDIHSDKVFNAVYANGVKAAVVDSSMPNINQDAWIDMISSLAKRIPVFVLGSKENLLNLQPKSHSDMIAWMEAPVAREVATMLEICGAFGNQSIPLARDITPLYNAQIPIHILKSQGALSMLVISASGFRKIAVEFGVDAYLRLQETFHKIITSMWGKSGFLRRTDLIMRKSTQSNTYFVFLEHSRMANSVPAPGVLERMTDRLVLRMREALWMEILKPRSERFLPDCISQVPEFSIGHATSLYNPCVEANETLEQLIDSALDIAKVQLRRIKDREKELLHTIIQTRDILYPHYQAVFELKDMTKALMEQVQAQKSIAPIQHTLYGFESLIRSRKDAVESRLAGDHLVSIDNRLMRPDILFSMAAHSKVSLELDQICLELGVAGAVKLPGKLMVNILPRNLLHVERLKNLISPRGSIIFEISESERISNPELMQEVREYINKIGCSIAADDFGKGHASIERVMKLRPELIKLDRSLVENIHTDNAKRIFAEGIVKAASLVKAKVLAEGIETWAEAQVFKNMGVDLAQGFLFHRPQPLEDILQQLDQATDTETLDSVA